RRVAIKVLHPDLAAALGAQRFLSEIKTTANLQHPHILPLHDSGEAGGLLFYVMPYVEGESLRDRLKREKPLPIDDAVRITCQVASALDYAHRHGVIHRDIKPENILLHDGSALVADFGIALAVQSAGGERMTQTGLSLGTPQYMSPEQAMGEKQIDARTDVYALGAVLYEMLTGDPPFTGSTVQAIVAKVISAEPEPVTMLRKSTPRPVAAAVHRALEKLPADRFATAQAFAESLTAPTLAASSAMAERYSGRPIDWRAALGHPLVIGIVAVGIAAISIAAFEWHVARRTAPSTVQRFTIDLPTTFRGAVGANLAISPDGSAVVFSGTDASGVSRLYLRRLDDLTVTAIAGTEGGLRPFWAPDGQWVAFWVAGRLMKVDLRGGTPQPIGDVVEMTGGTWTGNGTIVVSINGQLVSFPAAGGSGRKTATVDSAHGEVQQFFPIATPDGDHVVYASWGTGGLEAVRLGILTISTGHARRLDVPATSALGVVDGSLIYGNATGSLIAAPVDPSSGSVTAAAVPVAGEVTLGFRGQAEAALSASGTLVYASGGAQSRLVLADSSGDTPLLPEVRDYGYPRYSPDGKRLAVAITSGATSDVWVYDFATRSFQRLSSGGSVNERPEWSSDGARVLYRSDRSRRSAIWWQPIDQSAPASALLADSKFNFFEAVMSPDGRYLVFQVDTSGGSIGYRMLEGDTSLKALTGSRASELMPRVSPDGHWVAFVSAESGMSPVVVQPFPGPGPRIQISSGGGFEPVWAPDGRRLYYRSNGHFVVASIATTPKFRVTSTANFMDDNYRPFGAPHANYDVSPDGKKLLVVKGETPRLVVVHNWWSEVQRRRQSDAGK
ncbi:MAG: protein kinase domain-containing protein, partial [Gemmatimonas sp.]